MKEEVFKRAFFKKASLGKIEEALAEFKKIRLEKEEEKLPFFFLNGFFEKALSLALNLSSKPLTPASLTSLRNPWLYDFLRNENYENAVSFLKRLREKLKAATLKGEKDLLRRHYCAVLSFYLPGLPQEDFPATSFYNGKMSWALAQRGKVFLHEGKFEKACSDFKKTFLKTPFDWESGCLLAETLVLKGNKKEGFALFEKILKEIANEEEKLQAAAWQGELYLFQGEPEKALEVFKNYPKSFFSPCWEAAALFLCKKPKEAEKLLITHLKKAPMDYEALFWLIEIFIDLGKKRKAKNLLKKLEKENSLQENRFWLIPVYKALIEKKYSEKELSQELKNLFGNLKFPSNPKEILKKAKGCRRDEPYLIKAFFSKT